MAATFNRRSARAATERAEAMVARNVPLWYYPTPEALRPRQRVLGRFR